MTEIQEYTYPYEYYAAGPSRVTAEDGIHQCVYCDTSGVDETYTYCRTAGQSPAPLTSKRSGWKASLFVRAVR